VGKGIRVELHFSLTTLLSLHTSCIPLFSSTFVLEKLPHPETTIAVQELPGGDLVGNIYTRTVKAVYASGECAKL